MKQSQMDEIAGLFEWISQAGFFAHAHLDDADIPSFSHYASKI